MFFGYSWSRERAKQPEQVQQKSRCTAGGSVERKWQWADVGVGLEIRVLWEGWGEGRERWKQAEVGAGPVGRQRLQVGVE